MPTLDEGVTLVAYQADWPLRFAAEQQRLAVALNLPASQLEHIGSTAVRSV